MRYLTLLLLFLFPSNCLAIGANQPSCFVNGVAASSTTCTSFADLAVTSNYDKLDENYYFGSLFTPTTARSICKVSFVISSVTGSISGKTYTARIWSVTQSGGEIDYLVTELGSSTGVTGSNSWSSEKVSFTFSTSVDLTSGTRYAITLDQGGVDSSNYPAMKMGTSPNNSAFYMAIWNLDKVTPNQWSAYNVAMEVFGD